MSIMPMTAVTSTAADRDEPMTGRAKRGWRDVDQARGRPRLRQVRRPQRLVAVVYGCHRRGQRSPVQLTLDRPREQAVPGQVGRVEQVPGQVDQLHRRQRHTAGPSTAGPSTAGWRVFGPVGGAAQRRGQRGGRGVLVEQGHRHRLVQPRGEPGAHPASGQRAAAEVGERHVRRHPVAADDVGEDLGDQPHGPVQRHVRAGLRDGCRARRQREQRALVQFALCGPREGGDRHHSSRPLVSDQRVPERRDGAGQRVAGLGRHAEGQQLGHGAGRVPAGHDPAGAHRQQRLHLPLDLRRLHPVPANLHLPVGAAEVAQQAVDTPAAHVAGAVHADGAPADAYLGELRRGQFGVAQVAQRQPVAGHADLAGLADPARAVTGQHVHRRTRHRAAERDAVGAVAVRGGDPVGRGEDRALHRPVPVEQQDVRMPAEEPADVRGGQPLPAGHDLAQAAEGVRVLVHDHVEEAAGEPDGVDAVLGHPAA
jgi:hypothetical protein